MNVFSSNANFNFIGRSFWIFYKYSSSSENHNGSPFSLLLLMPFFSFFLFLLYKLTKNVNRIIIDPDFLLTQTFISSFPETVTFVCSSTKVGFTPSMLFSM